MTSIPIFSDTGLPKTSLERHSSLLGFNWVASDTTFLFPWFDAGIREKILPQDFKKDYEKIRFSRQKYREVLEFLISQNIQAQGPGLNRKEAFLARSFEVLGSMDSLSLATLHRLEKLYESHQEGEERRSQISLNIAKLYLVQGDTASAEQILSRLIETSPNTKAYLELVPSVLRSDADIHKYISSLRKLIELGPPQAKLWWLMGRELSNSWDETGAAAALLKCHELNPTFLLGRKKPILVLHSAHKDTLAAILADYYLKNIDSENIEIHTIRVEALDNSMSDPFLRRNAIKALVLRDPGLESRLKQLVELDLFVNDTSAALENLNYWVKYHPQNKKVWEKLRILLKTISKTSSPARKSYLDALSALGQLGDSLEYKKWTLEKAEFLMDIGFGQQAESLLTVLDAQFRLDAQIHHMLGKCRLRAGKAFGSKDMQMAWELDPHNKVYARDFVATLNDVKAIKQNLEVLKFLALHNPTIVERYKLAFCLNQMGSHYAASKAWDPVLTEDPMNLVCDTFALDSYRKAGRLFVLKPWLEIKLKKEIARAPILSLLAEACDQAGQQYESLKWMKMLASEFPFYGDMNRRVAKLKIVLGDFHAALQLFSQVLMIDSAGFNVVEKAKRISEISGDTVAIESVLIAQCDLYPKDVILLESLTAFYHRTGQVRLEASSQEKVLSLYPEGIGAWKNLLGISKKLNDPVGMGRAYEQIFMLGSRQCDIALLASHAYAQAGLQDDQIRCLNLAVLADSSRYTIDEELGLLLLSLGLINEAQAVLLRAQLKGSPSAAIAYALSGYHQTDSLEQFFLLRSINLDTNHHLALYRLGKLYESSKKFDSAVILLRRAISAAPDSTSYALALALVLGRLERWDEAVKCLKPLLHRLSVEGQLQLVLSMQRSGYFRDAIKVLTNLNCRSPVPEFIDYEMQLLLELDDPVFVMKAAHFLKMEGNPTTMLVMAKALSEMSNLDSAKKLLISLATLQANTPQPSAMLAKVFLLAGQLDSALVWVNKSLAIDGHFAEALDRRGRI